MLILKYFKISIHHTAKKGFASVGEAFFYYPLVFDQRQEFRTLRGIAPEASADS